LRQLTLAEIEELRGQPTRRVFDALGVPLWRVPEIAAHVSRRFEERARDIQLFAGAPEMLAALADAGAVIGVVSSNSEDTVRAVMGPANMHHIASVECGAALFGKSRRFVRVMREVGAARERTIAVGDESRDLDAAAKAGILGLGVEWGYASPSVLREMAPGRTFPTVAALTAYLIDRA
jgi:phosphoglycolate phosphatase